MYEKKFELLEKESMTRENNLRKEMLELTNKLNEIESGERSAEILEK